MLEKEIKKSERYLEEEHSNRAMLKHLITLNYLTRGEIIEIILKNNRNKKNNFLLVISILNLIAMILLMLLLLLR